MKQGKRFKKAFGLANIGYWQLDLKNDALHWSDKVKELHEVSSDYTPTLKEALNFYLEGSHRITIQEAIDRLIEEGISYDLELKIMTANKNERWIRTVGDAEFQNGECILLYGTTQDIHERKKAQERLNDIIEYSTNMFFRRDSRHFFTYVSPQSTYFLGKKPEHITQEWFTYLTDHPVNQEAIQRTQKAIETGVTQPPYDIQIQRPYGAILWARVNEAPIVEEGETTAIVGSLTDITQQKKREEELEKLSRIARETQNIVIITDPSEYIQWVNQAFTQVTGYSLEEVKDKKPGEFLQGEDTNQDTVHRIALQIEDGGRFSEEILNYTKDGTPYWINMHITPIKDKQGNIVRYFSIQEEITEKKEAEIQLEQHNKRLKQAQRVGNIGDWWYTLETGDISWSSMLYALYDRDPENGDLDYEDLIYRYSQDPEYHAQKIQEAIEYGRSSSFDQQIRTEKGSLKYVHKEIWPLKNDQGKVIELHGTVQDITARKKAELELEKEVSFSNAIIDGIPGLFYMIDKQDLTLEKVNQNVIDLFDLDPEHISKVSALHLIAPRERNKAREKLKQVNQEGYAELKTILKIGDKERHYFMNGSLLLRDGQECIIGIGIDITERVDTQKNNKVLLQEIHHRVKNNLAIISGLLKLEMQELDDEKTKIALERSVNRIQSIAKVHELLYQSSDFTSVPVNEYIDKLSDIVRQTLNENQQIKIHTDLDDIAMNVNEAIPLGMLLNELLTNSLKYAFVGREEGIIRIQIDHEGKNYIVHYQDNGRGFKQKPDLENAESLGLTIVSMLLKQLQATYEMKTENEFSLKFRFRKKQKGSHSNLMTF